MQKRIYRNILLFTIIILLTTGCGKANEDKQTQSVTEQKTTEITDNKAAKEESEIAITSNEHEIKIEVGETKVLSYTVTDGDTDNATKFQSGDTGKVAVDENGNVTGIAEGKSYVVAKCGDAKCYWNVSVIPTASITSEQLDIEICVNNHEQLKYTVDGGDGTYKTVFSSSDETIATVDKNGDVTIHKEGNVIITGTYGKYALCEWHIIGVNPNILPDGEYACSGNYENPNLMISETSLTTALNKYTDNGDLDNSIDQNIVRTIEFSPDCFFGYCEEEVFECNKEDLLSGDAPCYYFTIKDNVIIRFVGSP